MADSLMSILRHKRPIAECRETFGVPPGGRQLEDSRSGMIGRTRAGLIVHLLPPALACIMSSADDPPPFRVLSIRLSSPLTKPAFVAHEADGAHVRRPAPQAGVEHVFLSVEGCLA